MPAAYDKYSVTQYSVSSILGYINAGDIAIPEIQRPFVWKGKHVQETAPSYGAASGSWHLPSFLLQYF